MKKEINNYLPTILMAILLLAFLGIGIYFVERYEEINGSKIQTVYDTITMEQAVQKAIAKVEDAVVGISFKAVVKSDLGESESNYSTGSGVIYRRDSSLNGTYSYYVITNRHVITGSTNNEIIGFNTYVYLGYHDLEIAGQIIGYDTKVDLAVIRFTSNIFIEVVEFGTSSDLTKGTHAIAIGNPDGYDYFGSATLGIISAPLRYLSTDTDGDGIDDFAAQYIQHDVAINPGNSGGGLFDLDGRLIGINTLKISGETFEGMGFAIPVDVVKLLVTEYIVLGKEIVRPKLGVMGMEVRGLTEYIILNNPDIISIPDIYGDESPYGIYVSEVSNGSTIAQTSIVAHDIILSVGGVKITRTYILTGLLNSLVDFEVGDRVEVKYYCRSANQIKTETVTLKA